MFTILKIPAENDLRGKTEGCVLASIAAGPGSPYNTTHEGCHHLHGHIKEGSKDTLTPPTLTCTSTLRQRSTATFTQFYLPAPPHHPFHFKKEKKNLLPQLGRRRGHRWKSIKWLELSGMEKVSAMIWTQLGLIITLIHSHFGREGAADLGRVACTFPQHSTAARPLLLWFLIN